MHPSVFQPIWVFLIKICFFVAHVHAIKTNEESLSFKKDAKAPLKYHKFLLYIPFILKLYNCFAWWKAFHSNFCIICYFSVDLKNRISPNCKWVNQMVNWASLFFNSFKSARRARAGVKNISEILVCPSYKAILWLQKTWNKAQVRLLLWYFYNTFMSRIIAISWEWASRTITLLLPFCFTVTQSHAKVRITTRVSKWFVFTWILHEFSMLYVFDTLFLSWITLLFSFVLKT